MLCRAIVWIGIASFLWSPVARATNQVFVVQATAGPGVDFTHLQQAIDAAGDGDVILIRSAEVFSNHAEIVAKSLTLLGDPATPGHLVVIPDLDVKQLTASQRVTLRGLAVQGTGVMGAGGRLEIRACAGPVIVEDCTSSAPQTAVPEIPFFVINSTHVLLTRCFATGSPGNLAGFVTQAPATGLLVQNSSVTAYDCDFTGGNGNVGGFAGAGGATVLGNATLFAAGGSYRGGQGAPGSNGTGGCAPSGNGGAGILANGTALIRLDVAASGGAPGVDAVGCPLGGVTGMAVQVTSGSNVVHNEILRSLEIASPIREGQPVTIRVTGLPGEPAQFLHAFAPSVFVAPTWKGTLIGAAPLIPILLGMLPPSGTLEVQVAVPAGSLPAGIDGVDLYEQVLVPGANGLGVLSAPTAVTVVR